MVVIRGIIHMLLLTGLYCFRRRRRLSVSNSVKCMFTCLYAVRMRLSRKSRQSNSGIALRYNFCTEAANTSVYQPEQLHSEPTLD